MTFNGTSWVLVGSAGFSAGDARYTSLAFAADGAPYVAYMDVNSSYKATVMKFNGISWVVVGSAGFSAGEAKYTSLAFAADGTPYLAYRDYGAGNKATVMKFNGISWVVVGTAGFSVEEADYTSLAFAPDGAPYMAYRDAGSSSKVTVMTFNGTSWVLVGSAGFSGGDVYYTSLAFAPDGVPYLAYQDGGNSNKVTVMKVETATTTTLSSDNNPATIGSLVTFTATVSPSADTGTVVFYADETKLGSSTISQGVATYSTTSLTAGAHGISAVYSGRPGYLGSTSEILTQQIDKITPTVTTWPTAGAITYGQALSASTLTGGSASVPGTFAFIQPKVVPKGSGTDTYDVIFTATDSSNYTRVGGRVSVTVNKADTTVVIASGPTNPSIYGNSVTFGAKVSPATATGIITFKEGPTTLGTGLPLGKGIYGFSTSTLPGGTHIITAVYDGDGNYNGSTSAAITQTVQVLVTVATTPATGPTVTVDGTTYTGSRDFVWDGGSSHTITTTSPQSPSAGSRYVFTSWSDNGALSHAITTPTTTATYTATFGTQYQLTTVMSPATAGYVLPSTGNWYAADSTVNVSATPNTGYTFSTWSGPVANPNSAATTVTMTGPVSITANLTGIPALSAKISAKSGAIDNRLWTLALRNDGTGTATNVRLTGMTITSGSCTPVVKSTLPIAVADIAGGASQTTNVTIDFTGCAGTAKFNVRLGYSYGSYTGSDSFYNVMR